MLWRSGAFVLLIAAAWSPPPQESPSLFRRILASTDLVWLESIALNKGSATTLLSSTPQPEAHRRAAYLRLGAIGNPAAIGALDRIETALRDIDLVPPRAHLENTSRPDSINPSAPIAMIDRGDTTFALFGSFALRGPDIFIASSTKPMDLDSWTRPRPTRLQWQEWRAWSDISVKWTSSRLLEVRYQEGPRRDGAVLGWFPRSEASVRFDDLFPEPTLYLTRTIDLDDVLRDSDADGWTDLEEQILDIDPNSSDSDRDGLPDGRDACPNLPRSLAADANGRGDLIARAFFAVNGLSPSRAVMTMKDDSAHFWGVRAPIMRRPRAGFSGLSPLTSWDIQTLTADEARVWVWVPGGHGQLLVVLKRVAGRWVATTIAESRTIWS